MASIELGPTNATIDSVLECTIGAVTDADGDSTLSVQYTWFKNGTEIAGVTSTELTNAFFAKGDVLSCEGTPTDGQDNGVSLTSNSVLVVNTPAVVETVEINPTTAVYGDSLQCSYAFFDADGDGDQSTAEWFVNGQSVGTGLNFTGDMVRNDVVECRVTSNDGEDSGNTEVASLTVSNTPAIVSNVLIAPSSFQFGDEAVLCAYDFADVDGDADASTVQWYVNGNPWNVGDNLEPEWNGEAFIGGDQVTCEVIAQDGFTSTPMQATDVAVVANTAPTVANVSIAPSNPTVNDVLECVYEYTDVDGDSDASIISWTVGNQVVATGETLSGLNPGDIVFCSVEAGDGGDVGSVASSSTEMVCQAEVLYRDLDGDGYGDASNTIEVCVGSQLAGYVSNDQDCNDADSGQSPAEVELCQVEATTGLHRDEDCSGSDNDPDVNEVLIDNGRLYYADVDGDGFGDVQDAVYACYTDGVYTTEDNTDCNDSDQYINPEQLEVCATSDDEDCDGETDEEGAMDCTTYFYDADNDSYGIGNNTICACNPIANHRGTQGGDCDDADSSINPGQGNCGLMGQLTSADASYTIGTVQEPIGPSTLKSGFDYNGDGFTDIAIVDLAFDAVINGVQYTDTGAILVYFGPITNSIDSQNQSQADLIITNPVSSSFLGSSTGTSGSVPSPISSADIDGDGYDELMFEFYDNATGTAVVYTVQEGFTGLVLTSQLETNLPHPLSKIGDLDHDGVDDIVARENYFPFVPFIGLSTVDSNGDLSYSKICIDVYTMNDLSLGESIAFTSIPLENNCRTSVGSRFRSFELRNGPTQYAFNDEVFWGDFNGDGLIEFVDGSRRDKLQVFQIDTQNSAINLIHELAYTYSDIWLYNSNDFLIATTTIHDLNGDGYDDVLLGFRGASFWDVVDGIEGNSGVLKLFYGSSTGLTAVDDTDPDWIAHGEGGAFFRDQIGTKMVVLDINGDGDDDLIVPGTGAASAFSTYIQYGPLVPNYDGQGDIIPVGPNDFNAKIGIGRTGTNVYSLGDHNQDGYEDFILMTGKPSLPQPFYIFHGQPN